MLAVETPASWGASLALVIAAAAAAYATIYAARRGPPAAAPPALPPAPPAAHEDDDDDGLLARLWFETLNRGEALGVENAELRRQLADRDARLDVCERERLDLLRARARGDL